jgi:flavin reductase (DIM6/NTAB) family NADH-FMN oxidoreductase RutF
VSERRLHHADPAAYRHAMRALSSGVAIVACGEGERRVGCTVTALASLSLTPPTLIVSLSRTSSTLAGLRDARAFSVSLLAARHEALAVQFSGRGGAHGARRFEGAEWVNLSTGAPVLADAVAAIDCLVEEVIERHSHAIVLGAVVSVKEGADEPALVHWRGGFSAAR